eukprot:scaffold287_cov239-Pinguiococcus_pyrenoidosus.AAC.7
MMSSVASGAAPLAKETEELLQAKLERRRQVDRERKRKLRSDASYRSKERAADAARKRRKYQEKAGRGGGKDAQAPKEPQAAPAELSAVMAADDNLQTLEAAPVAGVLAARAAAAAATVAAASAAEQDDKRERKRRMDRERKRRRRMDLAYRGRERQADAARKRRKYREQSQEERDEFNKGRRARYHARAAQKPDGQEPDGADGPSMPSIHLPMNMQILGGVQMVPDQGLSATLQTLAQDEASLQAQAAAPQTTSEAQQQQQQQQQEQEPPQSAAQVATPDAAPVTVAAAPVADATQGSVPSAEA